MYILSNILLNKSFRFSLSQWSGSILLMFSKKNPANSDLVALYSNIFSKGSIKIDGSVILGFYMVNTAQKKRHVHSKGDTQSI